MTGSVFDGEDVVQEALFEAYRKIDKLDEPGALRAWMFRIAHNRCIDFIRRRAARASVESSFAGEPESLLPAEPDRVEVGRAIERLVTRLPPKERASVLLKDVFGYSHEEIADCIGSTVGGVKAALSRGRTKLAGIDDEPTTTSNRHADPKFARLPQRYVELFNQRDWDGV